MFTPTLGKIPNLTKIFQMGWFNHQPDTSWGEWCLGGIEFFGVQIIPFTSGGGVRLGSLGAPFIKNTSSSAESKSMSTDPLRGSSFRSQPKTHDRLTTFFGAPKKKSRSPFFGREIRNFPPWKSSSRPTWKIEFPGIVHDKIPTKIMIFSKNYDYLMVDLDP